MILSHTLAMSFTLYAVTPCIRRTRSHADSMTSRINIQLTSDTTNHIILQVIVTHIRSWSVSPCIRTINDRYVAGYHYLVYIFTRCRVVSFSVTPALPYFVIPMIVCTRLPYRQKNWHCVTTRFHSKHTTTMFSHTFTHAFSPYCRATAYGYG